jgi:hypothetical protein
MSKFFKGLKLLNFFLPAGKSRNTYLVPFPREAAAQFQSRADRSSYTNFVAPIIDTYHGQYNHQ